MISHEAAGSFYDDFQKPPGYLPLKPEEDHNQRLITPDTRHLSTPAVDLLVAATTAGNTAAQQNNFYPRSVSQTEPPPAIPTVEQQMYAQPFIEAFNQRIRQDSPAGSDIQCHSPPSNITHPSFASTAAAPNPSLASTAPTYVTATMSDINTLIPPSEASTSFSVTSTQDPTGFSSSYMPIPTYNHSHTAAPDGYQALLPGFNVIAQAAPNGQGGLQTQGFPSDPQSTMSQEMLRQIVPADMKTMEYMKVERKKARNRIAASKCRLRRLQRESDLQEKVRRLKDHNQELNNELNSLREKVHNLKRVLMKHMRTGCSVELPQGIRTDSLSSTGSEV